MVIVFYYRPLLTIRASVILVRERMMNKSQQVQTITTAAAQQMAAAVQKATEINVAVVFSVVDRGGNTLLIQRMDEAFVSSCDISLNKARAPAA